MASNLEPCTSQQRQRTARRNWTLRGLALMAGLLLVVFTLAVAELAARALFPQVNFQDTESSLLGQAPGVGYVWRRGREGACFGQRVRIDDAGCRDLECANSASDRWLILGDSVAFGVGVPAAETFVGRVQRALPEVRFLNTAVVGMHLDGHLAIARKMLERDPQIRRVTLFYCLNDLDGVSPGSPESLAWDESAVEGVSRNEAGLGEQIRRVLRSHSKLYLWLKGTLADRSQTYFRCDESLNQADNSSRLEGLNRLAAIAEIAAARGVAFDVVILPYEYQLRADHDDVWAPQRRVAAYLSAHGIPHVDARQWLSGETHDSRDWYLFGDPMHLSSAGHRAVADHWLRAIKTGAAQPHVTARPIDKARVLR